MKRVTLKVCWRLTLLVSLGRIWKKLPLYASAMMTWSLSCDTPNLKFPHWSSASETNVSTWTDCSPS
ncbi:hypothetical protein PF005_g29349 [Phytophthora fragariae]|uniref:Uncharacterized protein n=1 Tax=Phytophthora fragariae TaxID=53985 RepID=A0A6A3PMZ0_9STRA|nr:hypothetical protein PF009_g29769 [Phytophthora fragariae]KAE8964250.1 hypothetical protein PF011_g28739 [Phytophthora fragariae]KAE9063466.1 hypothetical protein PF010_g28980 [Phytophthora fragariae]KAE9063776.1 hypothetical protein PF007_g29434 [Phytophthora fragariae]KAE9071830.1 hypothetical protein PF006_g29067 [Phytophthora fragariae]